METCNFFQLKMYIGTAHSSFLSSMNGAVSDLTNFSTTSNQQEKATVGVSASKSLGSNTNVSSASQTTKPQNCH